MNTAQLLTDEHGTPLFAVIPYASYLDLLKAADQNSILPISEIKEIPLPYSGGYSVDLIRLVEFFNRRDQAGFHSIPVDARNEVLDKLMERYLSPESHDYPGLDILLRLFFLPEHSPYRNTRQAVREVIEALENTGIFRLTRESFPNSYRAVNALTYDRNAGVAYLLHHGAIDEDGHTLIKQPIPLNPFQTPSTTPAITMNTPTRPLSNSTQTIQTCGPADKRKYFSYQGSSTKGVTLFFDTPVQIPATVFQRILHRFQGQTVPAGVSMTHPTVGGIGEFVAAMGHGLTPRHASFICAILHHENRVNCTLRGAAIWVSIPA